MRRFSGKSLAAAAFAGLFITVASAWAPAAFGWITGSEFRDVQAVAPPGWAPAGWTIRTWLHQDGPGVRFDLLSESIWMGSRLGMSESTPFNRTITRLRAGWPLPTMEWRERWGDPDHAGWMARWAKGIDLPQSWLKKRRSYAAQHLPLVPVWPQFVLSWLLWGGITLFVVHCVYTAQRRRRIRRGLCPRCAYAIGSSSITRCPECGEPALFAPPVGR